MYITDVNVIEIFILGKRAKEKIVLHHFLKNFGTNGLNKTDDSSERFQRGGVIFNPKIYVTDFGPLNRAFRGKI